jgi:hypothetical protein
MGLQRLEIFFLFEVVWTGRFSCAVDFIGEDDCSLAARVLNVFYTDGDPCADDLFTDERVNDLSLAGKIEGVATSEPKKVSSAASSGVIELKSRAVGTFLGSAVKIPSTSFHI